MLTIFFDGQIANDSQSCNIQQWNLIANRLSTVFGVSKEVLKNRLQEIGFLKVADSQELKI